MLYYSEKTGEKYSTVKDLRAAEKAFDDAEAAKKVKDEEKKAKEDAIKEALSALAAEELRVVNMMKDFVKEYGHLEVKTFGDIDFTTADEILAGLIVGLF